MRFFFSKGHGYCHHCKSEMQPRDLITRLTFRTTGNFTKGLLFHPECYLKWNEMTFTRKLMNWKQSQTPPPKRGRKLVRTSDRPQRRRLLSLRSYHRHLGHQDRVDQINQRIKELENGSH